MFWIVLALVVGIAVGFFFDITAGLLAALVTITAGSHLERSV